MKITKQQLKQIIKEELEATLSLRQESPDDATEAEAIAKLVWDEGIRFQGFGEPNREPKLKKADQKSLAAIAAVEAKVDIDDWGDAVDHKRSSAFGALKDEVMTALWRMQKKQAQENGLAT
tara:strand:- start:159 stop:521 length:363 start_codon:yes stop_codon:yes gene_type:complete